MGRNVYRPTGLRWNPEQDISLEELAKMFSVDEEEILVFIRGVPSSAEGFYPAGASIAACARAIVEESKNLSMTDIAEMLQLTTARVNSLVREQRFKQHTDGKFPLRQTMFDICKHLRERAQESRTTAASVKNESAQIELSLRKLELEKQMGLWIKRPDVDKAWEVIVLTCRTKLLRIPNKVAGRVAYLQSESEIEKVLTDEVEESLGELSKQPEYEASNHEGT